MRKRHEQTIYQKKERNMALKHKKDIKLTHNEINVIKMTYHFSAIRLVKIGKTTHSINKTVETGSSHSQTLL